jgi:DNA-binding transcriptional MocR family regulator
MHSWRNPDALAKENGQTAHRAELLYIGDLIRTYQIPENTVLQHMPAVREAGYCVVAPGILFYFGRMEEQRTGLHRQKQQGEPDPKFGRSLDISSALSAKEPD